MSKMHLEERKITKKIRPYILERDDYTCQVCGDEVTDSTAEVHHIHALYLRGHSDKDNLATLCGHCHSYAPETGKEEFQKYKEDPIGYRTFKMLNDKSFKNDFEKSMFKYNLNKIDEYFGFGEISKQLRDKLCNFEIEQMKYKLEKTS